MASRQDVVDLVASDTPQERIGISVAQSLALKGYCVLRPDVSEAHLENVLTDISLLESEERFAQPPTMIVEGLLGVQGSAKVCELEPSPGDLASKNDGDNVAWFDSQMTEIGFKVAPYLMGTVGIEVVTRTPGVLHQAGMPTDEGPELTGESCAKWVQTFAHHRIMAVWCLGPEKGGLEMQPFDDDCNSTRVSMEPGTLVLLRPDALQHRFSAVGKAYCLTTFYQKEGLKHKHKRSIDTDITPTCQALEEWAQALMREYKESIPEDQARMALPRHWESLANHTSFVGQHISVRTAATRQVAAWDPVAWTSAFLTGSDYVTEVPLQRWSHEPFFDPEPESYKEWKTNCKHGSFIDGVDLFDNTLFRISKSEAQGMDPGHRLTLETGYEALVKDGYKVSKLMNSKGGVYISNPPGAEWGDAPKEITGGGVCGGGGSIACGRFSFTMGMKGPCISVDVEGASSLVAINFASTNLSRTGNWDPIPFALVSTWNLQLSSRPFIFGSSRGVLSTVGRTFSFDASSCGYVRGDCVDSVVLKSFTDIVDGDVVVNDKEAFLGVLAASATNQSGKRANMSAPDGAAFQEVLYEAIRMADISPLDVDTVDVYADGSILHEAIEAASTVKACRPEGMHNVKMAAPLVFQTSKTNAGNQLEACGVSSVMKLIIAAQFGLMYPNVHLRLLNPHMDLDLCARPALINTELLEFGLESSYQGITNRSMTGTNCHVILWGQLTADKSQAAPGDEEGAVQPQQSKILYWPEGGGDFEEEALPKRSYNIVGSWNRWEPQAMESEGTVRNGVFTFQMTLGENRWERFQIVLDGSKEKVLYPEYAGEASKGAAIHGPKAAMRSDSWLIDGRDYPDDYTGQAALADAAETPFVPPGSEDVGQPGDQYLIRLRVKGKFRAVDWEKLPEEAPAHYEGGSYQLITSWYHSMKMDLLHQGKGLYVAEVTLPQDGWGTFQIIREHDWGQVLYPAWEWADMTAPVLGPDEGVDNAWALQGRTGDVVRVQFQRNVERGGVDEKTVSWNVVRHEKELHRDIVRFKSKPSYFICGMWDFMKYPLRMNWTSGTNSYCQFFIQLGSSKRESFVIYQDGDPSKCFNPNVENATGYDEHKIVGPGYASGQQWTVGVHEDDEPEYGKRYEIRLRVSEEDGTLLKLDWVPVKSVEGLEDARGRGFMYIGE
mmetsp:Transcript_103255/g.266946  ORF Transcript_103255/g.266946 Transcript_103255/m.266946 type:complete len:1174 (+) Transcript_103255:93-3614(+)